MYLTMTALGLIQVILLILLLLLIGFLILYAESSFRRAEASSTRAFAHGQTSKFGSLGAGIYDFCLSLRAEFNWLLKRNHAQIRLYEKLLAHRVRHRGTEHISTLRAKYCFSTALSEGTDEQVTRAEPLATELKSSCDRLFGEWSLNGAHVLHLLGFIRHRQKRLAEAEDFYRRADAIYQRTARLWDVTYAQLLERLARVIRERAGDAAEANNFERIAAAIRLRARMMRRHRY